MTAPKVLRVNATEERNDYRDAVRQILLDIQRDEDVTLVDIAEAIDVTVDTLSNAANRKNSLNATYLQRIGKVYGGQHLDPYHNLYGIRGVPLQAGSVRDILPFLARATSKIAEARDPQSEGGGRETHRERLNYLPELEKLQAELSKLICEIQTLRVRAVA